MNRLPACLDNWLALYATVINGLSSKQALMQLRLYPEEMLVDHKESNSQWYRGLSPEKREQALKHKREYMRRLRAARRGAL